MVYLPWKLPLKDVVFEDSKMLTNFRSVMKNALFYYTCSPVTYACAADVNAGPLTKCHSEVINSPESYSEARKFNSST
jgi:hypothetical protein